MYTNPEMFKELEINKKHKLRPDQLVDQIGRENRKEGLREAFKMFGIEADEEEGITL